MVHDVYYTDIFPWPTYLGGGIVMGGGTVVSSGSSGLAFSVGLPSSSLSYGFSGLHAGMVAEVSMTLDSIDGTFTAQLIDDSTGMLIGSTSLYSTQGNPVDFSVPFTSISDSARLRIISGGDGVRVVITRIGTPHDTLVPHSLVTTVCDNDQYRYGYNGQMKVNEIAGVGNHNTALYGELDTRTGRRWNSDPKSDASKSPYSMFGNSPIWQNDVLLDSPGANTPWYYPIAYLFYKVGQSVENSQGHVDPITDAMNTTMGFLTQVALLYTPGASGASDWEGAATNTAEVDAVMVFENIATEIDAGIELNFGAANNGRNTNGAGARIPYANKRPSYKSGQVDAVWSNAQDENGIVRDPNTGKKLTWDKSKPRNGQWDMGHKPEAKYKDSYKAYMNGEKSKKDFLKDYHNPDNYSPEDPSSNRSNKRGKCEINGE